MLRAVHLGRSDDSGQGGGGREYRWGREHQGAPNKGRAGDEFKNNVARWNRELARAAFSSEHEPGNDGDVVEPRKIGATAGAG